MQIKQQHSLKQKQVLRQYQKLIDSANIQAFTQEEIEKLLEDYAKKSSKNNIKIEYYSTRYKKGLYLKSFDKITEESYSSNSTLKQDLLNQLKLENLTAKEFEYGKELISTLNKDGFIAIDKQSNRNLLDLLLDNKSEKDKASILKVQKIIQELDPVGTCTVNAIEAALVNAKYQKVDKEIIFTLQKILKDNGVQNIDTESSEFKATASFINSIDLHFGNSYEEEVQVKPELKFYKSNNKMMVKVLAKYLIDINEHDTQLENLKNNLDFREKVLKAIGEKIAEIQSTYLLTGDSKTLKIYTQQNLANDLNIGKHIISRIVSNKYISTDFGVISFKKVFCNKKQYITNIIEDIYKEYEKKDLKKPSDEKIVFLLKEKNPNLVISRRSIQTYRTDLIK